jgi:LysR family transcriptional regulator, regulator for genes of the gallate degradation pathway
MITAFELNLRHLDAIACIARSGSISSAAAIVNLSQPALTQALAKLEDQVGQTLVERQPTGVVATVAGGFFLPRIERAIAYVVEGCRSLRRSARLTPLAYPERTLSMAQLRALLSVQRAGSYAMAARTIGLAQPSVHRAVRELELILNVPLLVRAGRSMRATEPAERFIRTVRLAIAELEAGLDELSALYCVGAGRVVLGSLQLARAVLLPKALALFAQSHPNAAVSVIEKPYSALLVDLCSGDIDFIIGALRYPAPRPDILQRKLFSDNLSIVGRAGHPVTNEDALNPSILAKYPWVVGAPGAPMRTIWTKMFAGIDLPVQHIECSSILTARGLLLNGDWLALMSRDQFRIEEAVGLLSSIGPPVLGSDRKIGITTRVDWRPTAIQSALLSTIEEVVRQLQENQYQDNDFNKVTRQISD